MPVAVRLSPGRVALALPGADPAAGSVASLRLTVACGPQPARGDVDLDVPPGLAVSRAARCATTCPARPRALGPGCPRCRSAGPGHYFLTPRIRDQLGQVLEDATAVLLGGPPLPQLDLPPDVLLPALQADQQAIAAEVEVTVLTPAVQIRPGTAGELAVRLANRAASTVRGEAQPISPYGSWAALHPWTQGFTISPGREVTLRYHVGVPITTRRGTQWWTMVKLMYFG